MQRYQRPTLEVRLEANGRKTTRDRDRRPPRRLGDVRHRSVTETVLRHHAAFIDRPKYSAGFNAGRLQPGPERLYSGASPRIESLSGKRCSGRESSFGIKL